MISEWSCDNKAWSNGCWKISFDITWIILFLFLIHIEKNTSNCNDIPQYYCFYCIVDQINEALVTIRDFFQKQKVILPSKRSKSCRSSGSRGRTSEKSSWFNRSCGMSLMSLVMSSGNSSALKSGVKGLLQNTKMMSAHLQTHTDTHIQTHLALTLCQRAEWAGTRWKAFPGYPEAAREEWVFEVALVLLSFLSSYAS